MAIGSLNASNGNNGKDAEFKIIMATGSLNASNGSNGKDAELTETSNASNGSNGKDAELTETSNASNGSNGKDAESTETSNASNGSNGKDAEFKIWVRSMETMLGCVKHPIVEACSISFAPEQLLKSKVEAYTPRKISIGPLYRGASPDLIYMEDIKGRFMVNLLSRTEDAEETVCSEVAKKKLQDCSKAILSLDEILRASYNVDDIKFKSYDLAKIFLLDGCFLLELVMVVINSESNQVPEEIWEVVLSDLMVLGNQIPFNILSQLAKQLFPKEVEKITESVLSLLGYSLYNFHALSLLGYSLDSADYAQLHPVHVLGLVHSFITLEAEKVYGNQADDEKSKEEELRQLKLKRCATKKVDGNQADDEKSKGEELRQLKLKRCATKLEAAGVTIKHRQRENNSTQEEIRFDLRIIFSKEKQQKKKFRNGELEIPQLHITETTEAKWRNFIAWELTRRPYSKSIGCKFILYALFFQGLICSVHDIQLLRDREVIVVHDGKSSNLGEKKKKMNNEDLLTFFRNITEGVRDDQIVMDSQFHKLFRHLNSPLEDKFRKWYMCMIIWHFCRRVLTGIWYFCSKSFTILRRDHITTRWKLILAVAAFLVFACTFIKTFFPHLIP